MVGPTLIIEIFYKCEGNNNIKNKVVMDIYPFLNNMPIFLSESFFE